MAFSMYQASVPVFVHGLRGLGIVIDKAAAHAAAKGIDPAALLQARLFPDMYPFIRQVQVAGDFAKGCSARLAGAKPESFDDAETSFETLKARVERTVAYIQSFDAALIEGSEDRDITLMRGGEPKIVKGRPYVLEQAMPNFYFHITTAYNLMRHNGVELIKGDFLGVS